MQKRKFQLWLTITTLIISMSCFAFFIQVSNRIIYHELINQAINDNLVIGQSVLNLIKTASIDSNSSSSKMIVKKIQYACNNVTLPNDGFICATDNIGKIVAFPRRQNNENIGLSNLFDLNNNKVNSLINLNPKEIFQGLIRQPGNDYDEVLASIPIENSNLRVLVHQNAMTIKHNAESKTRPLYYFGIILSLFTCIVVYFTSNKIIGRYESQLEKKNQEITSAYDIILEQKENIQDSINYAKRIQSAILPESKTLDNIFKEYFVFYKPKDIVSGDFYWVDNVAEKTILVVADCTGHGVPGAIMSMLGTEALLNIVIQRKITKAADILQELNLRIYNTLRQEQGENKDGMDIAICVFDKSKTELEFAGAKRGLITIIDSKVETIKGDRYSIGGGDRNKGAIFNNHQIKLGKENKFYMYSDGFEDQFGGSDGKKYSSKRLRELLEKISSNNFSDQNKLIKEEFETWVELTKNTQTDDILVMGFSL